MGCKIESSSLIRSHSIVGETQVPIADDVGGCCLERVNDRDKAHQVVIKSQLRDSGRPRSCCNAAGDNDDPEG